MGRRLRRFRPSPALVISVIALFVAIGGVSWAATKIGTNDIKRGAVTTKKLHKFAVTKTKLHGNSVKSGKVIDDSLTGADINESTLGQVPDADTVDGFNADAFLQSNVYKNESAVTQGTQLDATGTFYIDEAAIAHGVRLLVHTVFQALD